MRTLVYQAQEKGCGFATVKMALIHMSEDRRYAFLPEPPVAEAPDLGTLISYAGEYGLTLRAYEVLDPNELLEKPESPLLLMLREEGKCHLVFLSKFRRGGVLLLDPSRGKRFESLPALAAKFTGVFLRIEGYERKGAAPNMPPRLVPHAALSALALLPLVFLLLGFVALDLALPAALTVALFCLSLISSAFQKAVLGFAMERFDKRYLDGVDAQNLKRRRDLFVHYHAYKRAAFTSLSEVLGHLGSVLAALAFLFFHDLYLAAGCATMVTLVVLTHLLCDGRKRRIESEAAGLEATYFYALIDEEHRQSLRSSLSEASRKYALILSFREFGLLLAMGGITVLFCLLQGIFSAQIIVFYLLSTLCIGVETDRLFQCQDGLEAKRREEPFFLHNIAVKRNNGEEKPKTRDMRSH